jgi:hypothetical protein
VRANVSWGYRNEALNPEIMKLSRYAQELHRDRRGSVGRQVATVVDRDTIVERLHLNEDAIPDRVEGFVGAFSR